MAEASTPADDSAHDILAAEAFAVPVHDPALRRDPVVLPEDPTGIAEPHDVLAAEEFPMPDARPRSSARIGQALAHGARSTPQLLLAFCAGLLAALWVLRRR